VKLICRQKSTVTIQKAMVWALGVVLAATRAGFCRVDHERFGPDPIDAPLGFDARLHKARLAQHAQVLGHRSLRHPQPTLDLADRLLRRRQQAEDGPAVRLRDDGER
jgi:hypothetical protein